MAIDYGRKRVGIASTDETGQFAIPRAVWMNNKELVDKILELKEAEGVEKIIIGESKNLDRTRNPILTKIEELKEQLEKRGAKVILHPEIYTTVEARRLQGSTPMTDASAASLILKSYIEYAEAQSEDIPNK